MIKHWWPVLAVLISNGACAAIYNAVITGATKTGTQWAIKSPAATVNAGAVQTMAKVPVGGSTVNVSGGGVSVAGGFASVPVLMQVASTAASVALVAIRLNPAGLVVGLTAQWLLGQGLQYANNQWTKNTAGQSGFWQPTDGAPGAIAGGYATIQLAALAASGGRNIGLWSVPNVGWCNPPDLTSCLATAAANGQYSAMAFADGGGSYMVRKFCKSTSNWWTPSCTAPTEQHPAVETDFTTAGNAPLTDGAAGELVKVIDLPVNPPTFGSSAPVDVSSAPYLDPVSGRLVNDTARITPAPTAENPLTVRVDRYQVDAGAVPGQTAAPPAPTKEASIANQPLNIEFPSDYARQGEAQTAANSINNALGPKLDKITETGADPGNPVQPLGSEFDQSFFQGTFSSLLGWQLPAHSSQCPTSSFTFNSTSYTVDSHCQLVANHFSAFSSVMSVIWTILALFILLGA